jgi:5-methylcytosine-specific restriction protein A
MPRAPKTCSHADCTALAPAGSRWCPDHHRSGWSRSPRTASAGRTNTTHWKRQRALTLQRDSHQCAIRGPRCTVTATEVDHVVPVSRGGTDDLTNLQAACHACHAHKTAREARDAGQ